HVVPAAVLTQSKLIPINVVPINAVRLVSTDIPKLKVTRPRHAKPIVPKTNSPTRRNIHHSPSPKASNSPPRITAVQAPVVNAAQGNLVGGLPTKVFENDNTCVACKKGNQLKAYYKTKPVSSIDQPLYRLHIDRFRPTFVKSLNKKSYCLVVTDDYSRSDNGTEFKNNDLTQFCGMKGIKREFSVPRTPQQNGIAERKNKTLIETARTMLADSLLPILFWAEAVNTAYSLGKFDGKVDKGFLVGYPVSSKAFRVFNSRTRIFQETLHVNLLENKPNVAGFQDKFDAEKAEEEIDQQYVLFPVWSSGSTNPQNSNRDAAFDGKEPDFEVKKPEPDLNFCPRSSAQSRKQDDKTKKEAKGKSHADFNNLERFITVSPIPTTRVHKDYPVTQIIGDLSAATQHEKTIEEEVYVCQPPGFEDPNHPDKVYKVVKVLYGLHQAPRAWYETLANCLLENGFQRGKIDQTLFIKRQKGDILLVQIYVDDIIFVKQKKDEIFISQDKYVAEILRKFRLTNTKSASTPIDTEKPLLKDPDGEDVDVHTYRSMIGSLMYLTSLRPDIMFVVCACVRFQVTLKASHLHAVKMIFRYLKGKPHLGLWYPKDSPFDLGAYPDSDFTGASLDRKSTTGGCQFLGCRLISWQ
nr:hypothetical protein [Tanacetum cinerariifolium]